MLLQRLYRMQTNLQSTSCQWKGRHAIQHSSCMSMPLDSGTHGSLESCETRWLRQTACDLITGGMTSQYALSLQPHKPYQDSKHCCFTIAALQHQGSLNDLVAAVRPCLVLASSDQV